MPEEVFSVDRRVAFIYETETAVTFVGEGVQSIAEWDATEDRRIVGLHLLAQGFERLLKVTKALIQLEEDGTLPSSKQLRSLYGHVLSGLLDDVLAACRRDETFTARPTIRCDIEFLASDELWRAMLDVLSELGSGGRYHDLDTMLDGNARSESPLDLWEIIEMDICKADPKWLALMESDPAAFSRQWYPALSAIQTETLQRAARAITRMWTLGPAQENGRTMTGTISRYLYLMDDQLKTPSAS
ncbi:MAG: hypothetical protein KTV68_09745 [Acidimicrobiia bacterium]|nr:hypothetical protein [Acidimicrobiia bacterium]MCY4433205.1 hypothetical protein [bacterium]